MDANGVVNSLQCGWTKLDCLCGRKSASFGRLPLISDGQIDGAEKGNVVTIYLNAKYRNFK